MKVDIPKLGALVAPSWCSVTVRIGFGVAFVRKKQGDRFKVLDRGGAGVYAIAQAFNQGGRKYAPGTD
ncbi:MAG: hypothetical protein KJ072_28405, partial [Verrucomicrobia bacterium]|nr:hypothetical protein [Verrucomicrobiota bacterium]